MIYTVTLNPAIDLVVRLDGPLQAGTVNRAAGEEYVLGGKGVNVSGVLAELGCPSVALGFVAGATGVWLEQGLAARGLRTDFIRLPAGMTRINLKLKDGRETEINGAGPTVPPEAVAAAAITGISSVEKEEISSSVSRPRPTRALTSAAQQAVTARAPARATA